MTKTLLALAVVAVALLAGYRAMTGGEAQPVDEIVSAFEAGAVVVDVRRADEFAAGHVAGARNIDLFEEGFEHRFAGLDPEAPIYLYCGSGIRSGRAARVLQGMGFTRVVNAGGFSDLAAAGARVER